MPSAKLKIVSPMKECRKDGHQWDDDFDFCPYCGTMLPQDDEQDKNND